MDFAVVKIAGKQYLVKVGDSVTVEALLGQEKKSLSFSEVLLLQTDGQLKIGTPLVSGAVIKAEIVNTGKGEKITVRKFKAKSRYRRTMGFRPLITTLKISAISFRPR
jgi:large subunit ribosomal protein L21